MDEGQLHLQSATAGETVGKATVMKWRLSKVAASFAVVL